MLVSNITPKKPIKNVLTPPLFLGCGLLDCCLLLWSSFLGCGLLGCGFLGCGLLGCGLHGCLLLRRFEYRLWKVFFAIKNLRPLFFLNQGRKNVRPSNSCDWNRLKPMKISDFWVDIESTLDFCGRYTFVLNQEREKKVVALFRKILILRAWEQFYNKIEEIENRGDSLFPIEIGRKKSFATGLPHFGSLIQPIIHPTLREKKTHPIEKKPIKKVLTPPLFHPKKTMFPTKIRHRFPPFCIDTNNIYKVWIPSLLRLSHLELLN